MVHDPHMGLRVLLEDILEGAPANSERYDTVRRNLDLYVHDEMEGRDAMARWPEFWAHLQECERCREQHDMLLALLMAESRGELSPLPLRPASAPVALPWYQVSDPGSGRRPSLLFVFLPAYLHDSLRTGRQAAGRRSAPGQPAQGTLLLSYLGEAPIGEVLAQVYAQPLSGETERYTLTVAAVAEPMPRKAALTWGELTSETLLDRDGRGQFGPVPLAALDDAAPDAFTLRLEF